MANSNENGDGRFSDEQVLAIRDQFFERAGIEPDFEYLTRHAQYASMLADFGGPLTVERFGMVPRDPKVFYVGIVNGNHTFQLYLTTPNCPFIETFRGHLEAACNTLPGRLRAEAGVATQGGNQPQPGVKLNPLQWDPSMADPQVAAAMKKYIPFIVQISNTAHMGNVFTSASPAPRK